MKLFLEESAKFSFKSVIFPLFPSESLKREQDIHT